MEQLARRTIIFHQLNRTHNNLTTLGNFYTGIRQFDSTVTIVLKITMQLVQKIVIADDAKLSSFTKSLHSTAHVHATAEVLGVCVNNDLLAKYLTTT